MKNFSSGDRRHRDSNSSYYSPFTGQYNWLRLMGDIPQSAASAARRSSSSLYGLTWVAGALTICMIRLCGFVQMNAVDLPFEDQWDLLNPLFLGRGPWSCFFLQDGPQRQGLGGLIYWCIYRATHWNVRAEVWAEVIILALAAGVAVVLAARLRGRLAWSDAGFPFLLLSPIHWGTMTLVTMLTYGILPLLLVLLLACAWISKDSLIRAALVGGLGGLCLFTSYGLCGTAAAIGLALLLWWRPTKKKERRKTALTLVILGAAVACFSHGYHWSPGVPGWRFPMPNGWDYPRFCALMFTSLLGFRSISGATVAAGAVLLGFVLVAFAWAAVTLWRGKPSNKAKAVWMLTGTSLVYAALTAIGRLPVNIEAAFMWRYLSMMTPAICGLAIAAEEWAASMPRGARTQSDDGMARPRRVYLVQFHARAICRQHRIGKEAMDRVLYEDKGPKLGQQGIGLLGLL